MAPVALSALEETLVLMYQARRAQQLVERFRVATGAAIGERQRLVADLYYRSLSLGEIAETLGVPRSTAQRLVEDARIVYPWRPTATLTWEENLEARAKLKVWADGSPRSGPSGPD